MAIYKNGEIYAGDRKRASDISTAILSDAKINKDISYVIRENAEMQAQMECIKSILAIDIYSISDSVKIEVLRKILNVEEDT